MAATICPDYESSVAKYNDYIERHRAYAEDAFDDLFAPFIGCSDKEAFFLAGVDAATLLPALECSEELIAVHDLSKYGEDEFESYRIHFYPTAEEQAAIDDGEYDDEGEFDRAFQHHCTVNGHHPNHWNELGAYPTVDMPLEYIIEMICDWESMSRLFGGDTGEWFSSYADKERSCMTEKTLFVVERMISALF